MGFETAINRPINRVILARSASAPQLRRRNNAFRVARRAAPATFCEAGCNSGMPALAGRQGFPAVEPSSSRGVCPGVATRLCVAHALQACEGSHAVQTGGLSRRRISYFEPLYTCSWCCSSSTPWSPRRHCARYCCPLLLLHEWHTALCVKPDATLESLEVRSSGSVCSAALVMVFDHIKSAE